MKTIITLLLLQMCFITFIQERLEVKSVGFSMDIPSNWISYSQSETIKNLEDFDFSDKQMNDFIKGLNTSVTLGSFTKYDPLKYSGIIPTVKIRMHKISNTQRKSFINYVKLMNEGVKKQLDDFVIVKEPVLVNISGYDVVNSTYQFKLSRGDDNYFIKTNTFYILRGSHFITVNFIEEINKENNEVLFEDLLKSIKLDII